MSTLRLCVRALRALWRVGLLRVGPALAVRMSWAWWRCGGSLAFLGEVAALRAGGRVALVDDDGPITFAELRARYRALAGELVAKHGAGPGRLVAIVGRNDRGSIVALLAASRTGADVVLLNPDSPPRLLPTLLEARTRTSAPRSGAARPIVLHARDVDVTALAADIPRLALDEPAHPAGRLPRLARPGELCVLTAGSTGPPRCIGRRPGLRSVLPVALGLLDRLPLGMHRTTVLAVPCFHGHGLTALATALAFAAPTHLGRRHEIAPLLARGTIAEPPIVVSVPTLLGRWLATCPAPSKIAAVVTGSAPLGGALCRALLEALGPVVYNLYGSTEAGIISLATPAMLSEAPGTVGQPLPGTEVRILDPTGRAAPVGGTGRIVVRGPLVLNGDGWFDTGDLGRLDDAGRLYVCGRADGMFVSGGENVYPQQLEACLLDHPLITEAAVAVVADPDFGARMRAFVVTRPGSPLTVAEVRAWLRERLDRHQQPRTIALVDRLPRNTLGKIDRRALAALAARDPA